jgi:hypothetical protein
MTPLDELGMAITNAGYTWTPEMRKAYERGVREQEKKREWVGLTDKDLHDAFVRHKNMDDYARLIELKLKRKNGG